MRVLVVDDELQARKRLVRLVEELGEMHVVGACATAEEALALAATTQPDVVLLDISMPGLTGIEAHAQFAPCAVVFVTAHAEHAVDAFELGAVDYVLKPVTAERLAKALARAAERRANRLERIAIDTRAGTVLVDPAVVVYAAFDGALVTLYAARESWVTTLSLGELAERLGPDFVRVDRRHVLNLREVARLEPNDTGGATAITRSGARVPVSRQVRRDLSKRFDI